MSEPALIDATRCAWERAEHERLAARQRLWDSGDVPIAELVRLDDLERAAWAAYQAALTMEVGHG